MQTCNVLFNGTNWKSTFCSVNALSECSSSIPTKKLERRRKFGCRWKNTYTYVVKAFKILCISKNNQTFFNMKTKTWIPQIAIRTWIQYKHSKRTESLFQFSHIHKTSLPLKKQHCLNKKLFEKVKKVFNTTKRNTWSNKWLFQQIFRRSK